MKATIGKWVDPYGIKRWAKFGQKCIISYCFVIFYYFGFFNILACGFWTFFPLCCFYGIVRMIYIQMVPNFDQNALTVFEILRFFYSMDCWTTAWTEKSRPRQSSEWKLRPHLFVNGPQQDLDGATPFCARPFWMKVACHIYDQHFVCIGIGHQP